MASIHSFAKIIFKPLLDSTIAIKILFAMTYARIVSGAFSPFLVMPKSGIRTNRFVLRSNRFVNTLAVKILTKWGSAIYQSDNYDNSWDASGISAGTYYYEVTISSSMPLPRTSGKGWIVVIG